MTEIRHLAAVAGFDEDRLIANQSPPKSPKISFDLSPAKEWIRKRFVNKR